MKTVEAAPRAGSLIEGMRDFGYSLETAIADVIDNSITARASVVRISTEMFEETPFVAVLDDGHGMSEAELLEALRPGSRNPRDGREEGDLGRFGLGLKTASFSQCRRMTVVSVVDGVAAAARWDLDEVAESDSWLLQIPGGSETVKWAEQLGRHGTAVIWEKLDRLIDESGSDAARNSANRAINEAIEHLALVFHRFLRGERGLPRVIIRVNGADVAPRDPFCADNPATMESPVEELVVGGERIRIQAFTLPHHSKVSSKAWDDAGGREGYLRNQGFYVYRSGRLIIYGTWFGLARQTELTKLCRVRIDLPNSLDAEWKIDVKKASAQPPRVVRERLRTLVERLGASSRRVYTSRGTKLTDSNPMPVWARLQKDGHIVFVLNRDHPTLVALTDGASGSAATTALSLSEASLPLDALLADLGASPELVQAAAVEESELREIMAEVLEKLKGIDAPQGMIQTVFEISEPFRSNPDITKRLLKEAGVTAGG